MRVPVRDFGVGCSLHECAKCRGCERVCSEKWGSPAVKVRVLFGPFPTFSDGPGAQSGHKNRPNARSARRMRRRTWRVARRRSSRSRALGPDGLKATSRPRLCVSHPRVRLVSACVVGLLTYRHTQTGAPVRQADSNFRRGVRQTPASPTVVRQHTDSIPTATPTARQ